MAKIKTKELLKEYIKTSMGAPSIVIELTDDQLDICIDKSIERYSEYGYDGTRKASLLLSIEKGKRIYTLPDNVIAIKHLQASSLYSTFINIPAGYTLAMNPISLTQLDNVTNIDIQSMTERMARMSSLRSIFDIQINFDFNFNSKELIFFEDPTSDTVVMELALEYEPNEVDNIYNNWWIKERAIGEAYLMWGSIMGKYSSNLVNGSTINYDDMRTRGQEIIDKSEEELLGLFEPLGIYVF